MGIWDDIPGQLVPDASELSTLDHIVVLIREAVLIRHDLEEALSRSGKERTLQHRSFESGIGQKTKSINPKIYAAEHERLKAHIRGLIDALTTDELKTFLKNNMKRFMPDIGFHNGFRRVLVKDPNLTVRNQLVERRADMLIRLLLVGHTIVVHGHKQRNPFVDSSDVYYWRQPASSLERARVLRCAVVRPQGRVHQWLF
jgi:hypothetical protein